MSQSGHKPKRRYSLKQKVWEFVRRHRTFRVGEMMMIFDLKKGYAQWFLWWLKRMEYIRPIHNEGRLEDHVYQRVKEMPAVAPSSTTGDAERRNERRKIVDAKKRIRRLLDEGDMPMEMRAIEGITGLAPMVMIAALREMEDHGELAIVGHVVSPDHVRRDLCGAIKTERKAS
jgi:hypothetical protein